MPVVEGKLLLRPSKMHPSSFKNILKGKVIIVGIGNILRGDDGLGSVFIERLTSRLRGGIKLKGKMEFVCFDAGTTPENYAGKIIKEKPDTILIVDALHLGKNPGDYEILKKEDIAKCGLTTHDLSPNMFIDYLEKETKANIYMLGVQPEAIKMNTGLSEPVIQALNKIEEGLLECIS